MVPIALRIRAQLPETFELEDLIQAGTVGLLQAATTYRPGGAPFSYWARLKIRAAIIETVRGEAFAYAKNSVALDARSNLALFSEQPEELEGPEKQLQISCTLETAMRDLTARQRRLIKLAYYGEKSRSLRAIGRSQALGIGWRRVEKEHNAALKTLRDLLEAYGMGEGGMKNGKTTRRRVVPNDLELLDCLAKGWKRVEIADEYGKSRHAIEISITRLRERMGAKTSEHMMALFVAHRDTAFDNGYWVLAPAAELAPAA